WGTARDTHKYLCTNVDSSYREKYLLTRLPDISGRVAFNSRYRSAGRDN
ncbi:Uncharacterized protein APZ42_007647, partial [Daphnia magna]